MVIFYLSPINDHSWLQGHITQTSCIHFWSLCDEEGKEGREIKGFLPKSFALLVANTSITLNTIHYKHKRLYSTKKNSYLMSRISFFIIPDKIHIAHLFSSTFDNQSNNVLGHLQLYEWPKFKIQSMLMNKTYQIVQPVLYRFSSLSMACSR